MILASMNTQCHRSYLMLVSIGLDSVELYLPTVNLLLCYLGYRLSMSYNHVDRMFILDTGPLNHNPRALKCSNIVKDSKIEIGIIVTNPPPSSKSTSFLFHPTHALKNLTHKTTPKPTNLSHYPS